MIKKTITTNYKYKIEDSIKTGSNFAAKAIEKGLEINQKLTPRQRLIVLGATFTLAMGGLTTYNFTRSPEISIESTTTQIQKEINNVADELSKTKEKYQKDKLQNRIDELATLRADRTEIVEASGQSKKRLRNLIAVYRQTNLPVEKFSETTQKNPEKYTKRTFYKKIINSSGEKVPVYISEGHKDLINDVLDLIKNKKITFPEGYSTKKQKEFETYGVESEEARHIKLGSPLDKNTTMVYNCLYDEQKQVYF